jgi:SAM-dependent methyltransferase
MPDREQRLGALVDVVEAVAGPAPRVLDLACGTGSISRRLLGRLPAARIVALDVDPALLAIASATLGGDGRVRIVRADLADPGWARAVDGTLFDAVVTATALHWLPEPTLARLYRDLHGLVRRGGVMANADEMAPAGLPQLASALEVLARRRRDEVVRRRASRLVGVVGHRRHRPGPRPGRGRAPPAVRWRPQRQLRPSGRVARRRAGGRRLRRGGRGLAVGHRRNRRGRALSLRHPGHTSSREKPLSGSQTTS